MVKCKTYNEHGIKKLATK